MKGTKKRARRTASRTPQQAFLATSTVGDLRAQVRIAREVVHERIWVCGIDEDILDAVTTLAGDWKPAGGTDAWTSYGHHIGAAFALGIAMGQLVHPDMFKKDGAK